VIRIGESRDERRTRVYASRGSNRCSIENCLAPYYGSGFCKKHHQWHWKRGLLQAPVGVTVEEKLLAYSIVDENGCWIWKKGLSSNGYAIITLPGSKRAHASRVSYETFVGPMPDEMEACHTCDMPACICPWHLFPGTHQENMRDSALKGRARQPKPQYGINHKRAVFDTETVIAIRTSPDPSIAWGLLLGVSAETVNRCRRRETYRDI
jgi:hypothetical protein